MSPRSTKTLSYKYTKFMRGLGVNNAKAEAQWQALPSPEVEKGEILLNFEAAGLNRVDRSVKQSC